MITELRNAAAGFILRIAEAFNPDPEPTSREPGHVAVCSACDGDGFYFINTDDYLCDECQGSGKVWVAGVIPTPTEEIATGKY